MDSGAGDGDWTLQWPASVDRVDVRDGRLAFVLGNARKGAWSAADVAAAERCYTGQRVTVSESGDVIFVDPPVAEPRSEAGGPVASSVRNPDVTRASSDVGTGGSRVVLHVTADQVESARGLVRLRGPDRVDPLIRKLAETRPAPGRQP